MNMRIKSFINFILPAHVILFIKELKSIPAVLEAIKSDLNSLLNSRQIKKRGSSQKEILRNAEFKIYSQNGEDGILNYIFLKIGTTNKTAVEFGIQNGRECNTANLIINNGWNALLIDGDKKAIAEANLYYTNKLSVAPNQIKIINRFITRENINKILSEGKITGEIDLLSIDIDGNDYWIWKNIETINPRVVIIEYNALLGDKRPITVKYDSEFERYKKHKSGYYFGASLTALTKLAKKKGYILIGCDSTGCNAFFIRKDITKELRELSAEEAYYPDSRINKKEKVYVAFNKIKNLKFEEV